VLDLLHDQTIKPLDPTRTSWTVWNMREQHRPCFR